MFNLFTKKISWKIGLPLAVILLSVWPLCSFFATRPLVNLEVLPVSAIGVYPLRKELPVRLIEWNDNIGDNLESIPSYDNIPHVWRICFLSDKTQRNLFIRIIWIDPSGLFGQFTRYYEIISPNIKADLLKFIEAHQEDLRDDELQYKLGYMIRHYRVELTKLGDGDPYVGLERAEVANWIKEGKDPEAEWRKKYPAEKAVESQAK